MSGEGALFVFENKQADIEGGKKMKKVFAVLLLFVLCMGLAATAGAATYTGATGVCTWIFDDSTGVLTISGSGAMANYSGSNNQPWASYKDNIKKVVINDGVTTIGHYAFSQYSSLTEVIIPRSVSAIGNNAFYSCTGLKNVEYWGITQPTASSNAFSGTYLFVIKVPDGYNSSIIGGVMANKSLGEIDSNATYDINVSASPAEGGAVTGAGKYHAGKAAITAAANPGYRFVGWKENGAQISTDSTHILTVNRNYSIAAVFEEEAAAPTTYTVTIDSGIQNGGVSANKTTAAEGETVTLIISPAEGYKIDAVKYNDTVINPVDGQYTFSMPASNVTVTATFVSLHEHPVCGLSCSHTGVHDDIQWTAWESADSMPNVAGNYYLTKKVDLDSATWTVPAGSTNLCLNGKTFEVRSIEIGSGNTLSIADCGDGKIDGTGADYQYNNKSLVKNYGTLNLYSALITSSSSMSPGAGVYNVKNSTFNMYGGAITKCSASNGPGGGVYNESKAAFNMYGGSITGNSGSTGAGVYNLSSTFNMYGGEITGNKASMDSGVAVYSSNNFDVSGRAVISGNTNKIGNPGNVFLAADDVRIVVGSLAEGSSIGVTRYKDVGAITTGGANYIDCFFSDNPKYFVEKDGGNLKLSEKQYTVTVTSNHENYGTAYASKTSGAQGTSVTLTAEPADGYRLKEWKVISGGVTIAANHRFVIGTENVEIQAVFEKAPSYEVTVTVNPTNGGTVEGAGSYVDGGTATLTAAASTGYRFISWTENGTVVSTNASCTFTVTEERNLVANFEKIHTHTYGDAAFTWTADGTSATAKITCSGCEEGEEGHTLSGDAAVAAVSSSAGDCKTKGTTTYEAKITLNGQEYTDTKTVDGTFGDHDYGELIPEQPEIHTQVQLKAGVAAHYHCGACGKYFTEGKAETTLEQLTGEMPQHRCDTWVKTNPNVHWQLCGCGLKANEGPHAFDGDKDLVCDACGYERNAPVILATLMLDIDGETERISIPAGTRIDDLGTPQLPGYVFTGWTDTEGNPVSFPMTVAEGTTVLVARFEPIPELPKTGDDSRFGLWALLLGLSGTALIAAKKRAHH